MTKQFDEVNLIEIVHWWHRESIYRAVWFNLEMILTIRMCSILWSGIWSEFLTTMINTLNRYSLWNVNTDTRLFTNSLWVSSDLTGIIAAIPSISCWRTAGGVERAICSVANILCFLVSTYVSVAGWWPAEDLFEQQLLISTCKCAGRAVSGGESLLCSHSWLPLSFFEDPHRIFTCLGYKHDIFQSILSNFCGFKQRMRELSSIIRGLCCLLTGRGPKLLEH